MRILPIIAAMLLYSAAAAQPLIKGTVTAKKGMPIAGAAVTIKNAYDGAVADSAGHFSFAHAIVPGDTLLVTAIGYHPFIKTLNTADANTVLAVVLTEQITEMQAVSVSAAGSFLTGNKKGAVLSALDIVTTAQNGDITTALKILPGSQQVGEQEGLFVHGGTAKETKQFIDGALVPNPYYRGNENFAQRGRYNPFLFSGTMFSTGGYSAVYGDALSSIVLLTTVDMPERADVGFTLSPIQLSAGTQQVSASKKFSAGAAYSITAVAPYFKIVKPDVSFFNGPTYHNADVNFRVKTNGGILKFFSYLGNNHVGMRQPNIDSSMYKNETLVKNINWYNNLYWSHQLAGTWKMAWSNSYSYNKDNIRAQIVNAYNQPVSFPVKSFWMANKIFALHNEENYLQSRLVIDKRFAALDVIRLGGEYNLLRNTVQYNDSRYLVKDNAGAAFVEADHYFSNKLAMTAGGRAEYSRAVKKMNVAPRLSAVYKTGKGQQLSAAYGIFYQRPDALWLMRNPALQYLKATQFILNYTKATTATLLRAEAYYKDYKHLVKIQPLAGGSYTYNNNGKGYAEGVDVFWKDKKTIPLFEYWLSYSFIHTRRNYMNYTEMLQPDYATPHTFSLVLKKFIMPVKTQVNLTYTFATGRPYYYFRQVDGGFIKMDEGKTIQYNNLGASINYVPYAGRPNKKTRVIVVASASNILNFKQVYGYNYSYDGSVKTPLLPASRRFYYLGMFINIGTDRTQQIINDNL